MIKMLTYKFCKTTWTDPLMMQGLIQVFNLLGFGWSKLCLQVLLKQGERFTPLQSDLIKIFEDDKFGHNKNTYIETCSGCMYGEIFSLEELTESEFFNRMIENYFIEIK